MHSLHRATFQPACAPWSVCSPLAARARPSSAGQLSPVAGAVATGERASGGGVARVQPNRARPQSGPERVQRWRSGWPANLARALAPLRARRPCDRLRTVRASHAPTFSGGPGSSARPHVARTALALARFGLALSWRLARAFQCRHGAIGEDLWHYWLIILLILIMRLRGGRVTEQRARNWRLARRLPLGRPRAGRLQWLGKCAAGKCRLQLLLLRAASAAEFELELEFGPRALTRVPKLRPTRARATAAWRPVAQRGQMGSSTCLFGLRRRPLASVWAAIWGPAGAREALASPLARW